MLKLCHKISKFSSFEKMRLSFWYYFPGNNTPNPPCVYNISCLEFLFRGGANRCFLRMVNCTACYGELTLIDIYLQCNEDMINTQAIANPRCKENARTYIQSCPNANLTASSRSYNYNIALAFSACAETNTARSFYLICCGILCNDRGLSFY